MVGFRDKTGTILRKQNPKGQPQRRAALSSQTAAVARNGLTAPAARPLYFSRGSFVVGIALGDLNGLQLHLGGGLAAKDGDLKGFTIAGADKQFHPAQAGIVGDTVVVNSSEVVQPAAMCFGRTNVPEGNLFNRAGLPASPFRTDVD